MERTDGTGAVCQAGRRPGGTRDANPSPPPGISGKSFPAMEGNRGSSSLVGHLGRAWGLENSFSAGASVVVVADGATIVAAFPNSCGGSWMEDLMFPSEWR